MLTYTATNSFQKHAATRCQSRNVVYPERDGSFLRGIRKSGRIVIRANWNLEFCQVFMLPGIEGIASLRHSARIDEILEKTDRFLTPGQKVLSNKIMKLGAATGLGESSEFL